MRAHERLLPGLLTLLLLAGCSDSSTGPTQSHNDVSGSYAGVMVGMAQGVSLDAVFALTISQNAGALGGTYSITGTLSDGFDSVSIQGTGTLSGAIGSGTNPSVSLTVLTAGCASHPASFTGGFDTANQRLTLTGPVRIFDTACNVLLTYPTTITLTR